MPEQVASTGEHRRTWLRFAFLPHLQMDLPVAEWPRITSATTTALIAGWGPVEGLLARARYDGPLQVLLRSRCSPGGSADSFLALAERTAFAWWPTGRQGWAARCRCTTRLAHPSFQDCGFEPWPTPSRSPTSPSCRHLSLAKTKQELARHEKWAVMGSTAANLGRRGSHEPGHELAKNVLAQWQTRSEEIFQPRLGALRRNHHDSCEESFQSLDKSIFRCGVAVSKSVAVDWAGPPVRSCLASESGTMAWQTKKASDLPSTGWSVRYGLP